MKKLLTCAGLLCASISPLLGAYNTNGSCPQPCPPKPACPPKCPPPPSCNPAGKINDCMPMVILPDAGPRVCCGVDIDINASFIYWTARMDGLGFAVSGYRNNDDQPPGKGDVKHVDNDFHPGFKVGLGLGLDHDGWDIAAEYTWLYTSTDSDSTIQAVFNESTLSPMWNAGADSLTSPGSTITFASGSYDIDLNVIDLELGRNFFVSNYLKMRPHFGLKGTWYDADYSVRYRGTDTPVTGQPNQWRIGFDHDYWGVGIRAGLDTAWHFTNNFSIVGDVALSGMWGQFDVDRRDVASRFNDETFLSTVLLNTENQFHTVKPVLELFLGMRWDTWTCDEEFHFSLEAGWEEQVWWTQNQMFAVYEEGAHGDLVLHGLTIKARFDF